MRKIAHQYNCYTSYLVIWRLLNQLKTVTDGGLSYTEFGKVYEKILHKENGRTN